MTHADFGLGFHKRALRRFRILVPLKDCADERGRSGLTTRLTLSLSAAACRLDNMLVDDEDRPLLPFLSLSYCPLLLSPFRSLSPWRSLSLSADPLEGLCPDRSFPSG